MLGRLKDFLTPLRCLELVFLAGALYVTLWALHPSLVFSSSLLTGGDTGSHLALPAYLKSTGDLFNLTPWYPGWFNGMPAYTYYFALPDLIAVLLSYVISFAVAFKVATILGSLLLPLGAYAMGRLFKAPRPLPLALALSTLPFLFDASFTIDGGNLFSTMAGEYAFSLSLALSLVTIGLFARGMRRSGGYWLCALFLSLTLFAHVLPWFFAIGAVGVLVVFEVVARRQAAKRDRSLETAGDIARPLRFAVGAGLLSLGLSAWWLLPFGSTQSYTNSMGYTNDPVNSLHAVLSTMGWFNATGGAGGDRWVFILAGLGPLVALWRRDRLGLYLSTLMVLSIGAFLLDPQSAIWNERLIPFWFITSHLLVGWLVGYAGYSYVQRGSRDADVSVEESRDGTATVIVAHDDEWVSGRRGFRATMAVGLLAFASVIPGQITSVATRLHLSTAGNQVSSWAVWNYSGYQGKPAWPEYQNLMQTMEKVGQRYGCGNAMWEYNADENRFGTPEALMLLPYWTNNCIDSMEGLFFESSATTPYHFLDQAELSASPSDPQVGLPYGSLDVALGVRHLQQLGVRYFIAYSSSVIAQANADHQLQYLTSTKNWPAPGAQWRIYRVLNSQVVTPVAHLPFVVSKIASRQAWLAANVTWWLSGNPSQLIASSGPSSWPHVASYVEVPESAGVTPGGPMTPNVVVSRVHQSTQSISFHVNQTGWPVLVKISYFPQWNVSGATGPYRVSPNEMVVIPTSKNVSVVYGQTSATRLGSTVTWITVAAGLGALWTARRKRRNLAK